MRGESGRLPRRRPRRRPALPLVMHPMVRGLEADGSEGPALARVSSGLSAARLCARRRSHGVMRSRDGMTLAQ